MGKKPELQPERKNYMLSLSEDERDWLRETLHCSPLNKTQEGTYLLVRVIEGLKEPRPLISIHANINLVDK